MWTISCRALQRVTSSFPESETGSGLINRKDAVPLRYPLHEMVHIQGPTPIKFDNIVANGIITDTFVQRISKAIGMRFYWLHDRCQQKKCMFIGNK